MKRNQQVNIIKGLHAGKDGHIWAGPFGANEQFVSVILTSRRVVMTRLENVVKVRQHQYVSPPLAVMPALA